jgi:hypothetical protein
MHNRVTPQGDIRHSIGTAFTGARAQFAGKRADTDGGVFASCTRMAPEVVIGRWLAFCAHPIAAWRLLPRSGRCLIALSYAAVSYAAALGVLVLIS